MTASAVSSSPMASRVVLLLKAAPFLLVALTLVAAVFDPDPSPARTAISARA